MYVYHCCRIATVTVESKVCLIGVLLLQVYNKVDQISIEEVDRLAHRPNSVVIRSDFLCLVRQRSFLGSVCSSSLICFSCGMKLNLDYLLEMLWEYLSLICIYTKKRGGAWIHFIISVDLFLMFVKCTEMHFF